MPENAHAEELEKFRCRSCKKIFQSPITSVLRSIEQMHYYSDGRLPEAEVLESESIAEYCSPACLSLELDKLMRQEGVRITNPGPGPIEACSKCGKPVDMSKPHPTWTEDTAEFISQSGVVSLKGIEGKLLAVTCSSCEKQRSETAEESQGLAKHN